MGLIIESGSGNGKSAQINDDGRLKVTAISASPEHHLNHEHGTAFVISFSATPTGADDCFFYLKNTGEKDLLIEGFGIKLVANEYIDLKLGDDGTPVAGTDISPVNLNTSSGQSITGTIQDGNNITGLSGGNTAYRFYHATGSGTNYRNFEMDIVLAKNGVFTMYAQTGTTALEGFLDLAIDIIGEE
jgi:hypothetical protein